ncbi:MAG: SDR family NAD(P)-dependent oxidoreductase [Chloroflexi bacterium]|nr:SDR family NAD(P)-dependent oxidoreductase [Chloroflexota bacterium]
MGVLDGKVAIVTGSNRGIGRGIARGFALAGANLALAARDAALLEEAADEFRRLGAEVAAIPTDVTDEKAVNALIAATLERFGQLDVLVNNAGVAEHAPLVDMTLDAWQRTIDVNLTGPFLCARAALRVMAAAGRGRIINVASISSQRVRPSSASYSASKFGLWGLTQVIALEGRAHGVSCSCLNPGNTWVERRTGTQRREDEEPMMTVDELATAAVTMAAMPDHVNMLEATVLPVGQPFIGRG